MRVIDLARRRNNYPITDRLKGCNSLITTKSELATQLTVPESNLANVVFDNDNNEIRWHSRNNYTISRSASFSNVSAEPLQQQLSQVVEEFESSRMVSGGSARLFEQSELKVLKLTNYTFIRPEGLRGLSKLLVLEIPLLEEIQTAGLVGCGPQNGEFDILVDFPNLQTGLDNIGANRLVFENSIEPTITQNEIFLVNWFNTSNIPFAQSRLIGGNVGNNFFRSMQKLSQDIDLPQIIEVGSFAFGGCFELQSLKLINLISTGSGFLQSANSLTYLDIRSCTDLNTNTGNTISNTPNDGTIEANIALQDWQGSGNVHPVIQVLINKNWTVNYY